MVLDLYGTSFGLTREKHCSLSIVKGVIYEGSPDEKHGSFQKTTVAQSYRARHSVRICNL